MFWFWADILYTKELIQIAIFWHSIAILLTRVRLQ